MYLVKCEAEPILGNDIHQCFVTWPLVACFILERKIYFETKFSCRLYYFHCILRYRTVHILQML